MEFCVGKGQSVEFEWNSARRQWRSLAESGKIRFSKKRNSCRVTQWVHRWFTKTNGGAKQGIYKMYKKNLLNLAENNLDCKRNCYERRRLFEIRRIEVCTNLKRWRERKYNKLMSSRCKKLSENQETIQQLASQLQQMQEQMNSMNSSGEFQDIESNDSGRLSHVSSQPEMIPSSRALLSLDKILPLDTWYQSGVQENVFGNQFSTFDSPRDFPQSMGLFLRPNLCWVGDPWGRRGVRRRWWRPTARCEQMKKPRCMSSTWTYSSKLCFLKKLPLCFHLWNSAKNMGTRITGKAVKIHISSKMATELIAIYQTMYHLWFLEYQRVLPQLHLHVFLHQLHNRSQHRLTEIQ